MLSTRRLDGNDYKFSIPGKWKKEDLSSLETPSQLSFDEIVSLTDHPLPGL